MKKGTAELCLGASLVCAGAGVLWSVAPGRSRPEQRAPFQNRYFAHRGLFDEAAGIPENSLAAFAAAAERGYGAEMDVRLTRDGVPVISHDRSLERMCSSPLVVEDSTWAQLQELRLAGTDQGIPLFREALELLTLAGVPVIVEVKSPPPEMQDALCAAVLSVMDEVGGDLCVESFNPWIVAWFRKNAPDILRGQLIIPFSDLDLPFFKAFLGSHGMFNCVCRPQFISHRAGPKAATVRLAERMGAMRVLWTAHDRSAEAGNDAVIFEHFQPPLRYL